MQKKANPQTNMRPAVRQASGATNRIADCQMPIANRRVTYCDQQTLKINDIGSKRAGLTLLAGLVLGGKNKEREGSSVLKVKFLEIPLAHVDFLHGKHDSHRIRTAIH